jgi:hypothetical protein
VHNVHNVEWFTAKEDPGERLRPATIYTLCQALKPFFGPLLASLGSRIPYEGEDSGNAFWMEAAGSVYLNLPPSPVPERAKP